MKNVLKKLFFLFCLLSMSFSITGTTQASVLMEDIFSKTDKVSKESFDTSVKGDAVIATTAEQITQILLGVIGTVGVIFIIYAGFLWSTAGGNEDRVKTAKKIIVQVVIGIIVASLAYALVIFILTSVITSKVDTSDKEGDGDKQTEQDK